MIIASTASSKRILKREWKAEGYPFYRVRDMVILAENGTMKSEFFVFEEFYEGLSDSDGIPTRAV
jgi:type I restriction enzyme S subunit